MTLCISNFICYPLLYRKFVFFTSFLSARPFSGNKDTSRKILKVSFKEYVYLKFYEADTDFQCLIDFFHQRVIKLGDFIGQSRLINRPQLLKQNN